MSLRISTACWQVLLILLTTPALLMLVGSGTSSAHAVRGPIVISGDGDFTSENGVVSGEGTSSNPYVIEGWQIVAVDSDAVSITDTTAHFVLRDLVLQGGSGSVNHAVEIERSSNWTLQNSTLDGDIDAIAVSECSDWSIVSNVLAASYDAASVYSDTGEWGPYDTPVYRSCRSAIEHNIFERGGLSVTGNRNVTIADNNFNFPGWIAIAIMHCDLVNISRNNISGDREGIWCDISTNVVIEDNVVTSCTEAAVSIAYYSDRVAVDWNDLRGNLGPGIKLEICSNLTVSNNTLDSQGIYVTTSTVYSDAWSITSDNTLNGLPILFVNDAQGLDIDGAVAGQVIVVDSTDVRLRDMTISDAGYGVQIVTCECVSLENLTATDCSLGGIGVSWSNGTSVIGCNLSSNAIGLRDYMNSNTSISECSFDGNVESGVTIYGSSFSRIAQCNTSGGWNGVYIESAKDARIEKCEFRNQSGGGIWLYSCGCGYGRSRGVLVDANRFLGGGFGVYSVLTENLVVRSNLLQGLGTGVQASGCTGFVYWNNFTGNVIHASASSSFNKTMNWNSSYPDGGNFWGGYSGTDQFCGPGQDYVGPDGIGDLPYNTSGVVDYYPLLYTKPDVPDTPPVANITVDSLVKEVNSIFVFSSSGSWDTKDPLSAMEVRWDFDNDGVWDTNWSTEKVVVHVYAAEGSYSVVLQVKDTSGNTNSTIVHVTVIAAPQEPETNDDIPPDRDADPGSSQNDALVLAGVIAAVSAVAVLAGVLIMRSRRH